MGICLSAETSPLSPKRDGAMSTTQIRTEGVDHSIVVANDAVIHAPVVVRGRGNGLIIGRGADLGGYALTAPTGVLAAPPADQPCLIIEGDDNDVAIEAGCRLRVSMVVRGAGVRVRIGADAQLNGLVNIVAPGAVLTVGERTTVVRGSIQMHETGEITIGRDCMVSSEVYISVSDMHPIHDAETGVRINPAASISIGDHVWLGLRVMVMKGSVIGDGAVVAAGAVVTGSLDGGAVSAGLPARTVRQGVVWRRDFAEPAGLEGDDPTGQ